MAVDPKDIQNSEDLLNLSNQILDSYNERVKVLGKINEKEKLYRDTISQQQKLSQQITANADKYIGYQIKSKDLSKQIEATENNRNKSQKAFKKIQGDITKQYQTSLESSNKLIKKIETENKLNLQANNLIDLAKNRFQDLITRREKGENISLRTLATARINLKNAQEEVRVSDKLLKNLNTQQQEQDSIAKSSASLLANGIKARKSQNDELAFLRENLRIRKEVEKSTGLLGAISKSVAKIPGIGQYLNADEAIDEMEKLAASMAERNKDATSFSNRILIAKKGITTLAKGFYENIKSPEAVFTFFINAAMTANKESVNLSKNLGYGAANADRVRANFADIERSSGNLNVTTANLSEAFNELSTATGFVTEYSADALTTQIKLTKQLGLSGEEAASVYKFSVLTGQSSEATYKSMLKGYVATRNSLGVGVPFKAAIAEASKVSGQLASNLGNNPETIIKAVVATRALGTSLEQAKNQGEKLLDFQSSIENELKAELITGQQLNLERARAAALMGDQVIVAEELASQGMTAAKFSGMNVIAQKSFAEALGTTSDELANQLAKREMAIASGKSLAQITAEEADEATTRQDIQTKFNAAMEKLQSIIGNLVAGPLGSMLEMLSGALEIINKIGPLLVGLATTFAVIKGLTMGIALYNSIISGEIVTQLAKIPVLIGLEGALSAIKTEGAIAAISGVSALTLGVGAIAIIAGIAAAVGAMKSFQADDMVSPGYGKRTLLSPEGAIQFNNNDTIVAGTNLGGGIKQPQATMDLSPVIAAMNNMTKSVDRLHDKETVIKMGTKEVGTALMMGSYRSA
jgi:hypothetical protein